MKLKSIKLLAVLALVLGGCSNAYTTISKSEKLMNTGDVTSKMMYDFLLSNTGANQVLDSVMAHILNNEVPVTDEMKAEATEEMDSLRTALGESLSIYLSAYGYESEEQYYEEVVLYGIQNQKLLEKYVSDKFDTLALTQKPRKVQIIQVEDREKSKTAFDEINDGKDFLEVSKTYGSDNFSGAIDIYTSASDLDSVVLAVIQNATEPILIDQILEGNDGNFYIVKVIEADPEKFKEEAVTALASIDTNAADATRHFLKQNEFKIYDKVMYDQFKASAPDLIFD